MAYQSIAARFMLTLKLYEHEGSFSLNALKVKVHPLADVVAGVCLEEPLHTFASLVSRPVLPSGTTGVHGRVCEGDPTTRSLHSLVITYQDALTRLGPRVVAERL